MNIWPFRKSPETRQEGSLTDSVVDLLLRQAQGSKEALPGATAALEACSGLVSRAFASAKVQGTEALTPDLLSRWGRALIRNGQCLFWIDNSGGLVPVASHDVNGAYNAWMYRLNLAGPSKQHTLDMVGAGRVLHFRYAADPDRPWRGYGPLQAASLAGSLSAETVAALADEAGGPRGSVLPLPVDGQDPTINNLRSDLQGMRGGMAAVQSTASWKDDGGRPVGADWQQKRIGANPPEALVRLSELASREVYAACGLSEDLFASSDGTGKREAWRQALFGVIAPLGMMVEAELRAKLGAADIRLMWDELRASDLQGRARAYGSMVDSGFEPGKAADLAGLQ